MIEFLSTTSDASHGAVGLLAGGGGITAGWLIKYLLDKLNEKRNGNGNNGKVALTELKMNQQMILRGQDQTVAELKEIKEYSHEQAIYLKIMCEEMKKKP
jgi:hypothetical protein